MQTGERGRRKSLIEVDMDRGGGRGEKLSEEDNAKFAWFHYNDGREARRRTSSLFEPGTRKR